MYNFTHVIWDWNGTLLDDAYLSFEVFRKMIIERELPECSFDRFQRIYGHPIIQLYEKAGFDFAVESFDTVARQWHNGYESRTCELALHRDSVAILDEFAERGITQSVLSALPHDILLRSLQQHGLDGYFAHVLGLDDLSAHSKVDNGRLLLQTLSIDPADVILIGDSSHDAETASALGIDCLLVSRGLEHRDRLLQLGLPVFDNFESLLDCLKALR